MNDKVRKTLPLVGAIALTSSALLAGTGAAFAGKAGPTATPDKGRCTYLATSGETQYRVNFDLSANKGKWVFVRAELQVGDAEAIPAFPTTATRFDKNNNLQAEAKFSGAPESATMTLLFEDRKGNPLSSVPKAFCG